MPPMSTASRERLILIVSILIAGLCSIVYELLISTTASYFLGDSVRQFSITIGLYMAAMGFGAWCSRFFHRDFLLWFIGVEILLGLIGGLCVPLMYLAYAYTDLIQPVMFLLILTVGTLTGLEIPLLARVLERYYELGDNLANVLSFDYLGALLATLAFPFLLLPLLGVFQSSLVVGTLNLALGFLNLWYFSNFLELSRKRILWLASLTVTGFLLVLLFFSKGLLHQWTESMYSGRVIYQKETPYQNIVLTRYKDNLRLFLDGNLQFSSMDEYRYHEALIHLPLLAHPKPRRVLVLGGGDGLAARELLKYPGIQSITIVDLDPAIFKLAREDRRLRKLNQDSLRDPRVTTKARDAWVFLEKSERHWDTIIADLPDPNNVSLARLYSRDFYRLVRRHLSPKGVFVTQATSPYYATRAFWSVPTSLRAAGFKAVTPYHTYVPSFGDWGFVAASRSELNIQPRTPEVQTRYLQRSTIADALTFDKDIQPKKPVRVSTLDRPRIHEYYLEGWQYWH